MRAEDWKSFEADGFKLFKEGHVQNILINRDNTKKLNVNACQK